MTIITQIIGTETKIVIFIEPEKKTTTGNVIKIKLEVAMNSQDGGKSYDMAGISTMITSLIVGAPDMITKIKL